MTASLLTRVRERDFVLTLLWAGIVLGVSFLATPLKFLAPSLIRPVAMEIGYVVYHTLNALEIALALAMIAISFRSERTRRTCRLESLPALLLAIQTLLLYTVLDARTLAIIRGTEPPQPSFHAAYVGLEILKLALLLYLAHLQMERFAERIRRAA